MNTSNKRINNTLSPIGEDGGGTSQYLDLYREAHDLLCKHSAPLLNTAREQAYNMLSAPQTTFGSVPRGSVAGFPLTLPTRTTEAYRYTDVAAAFAPNYGLNLSRIDIPVNPYEAFRCDVPNLSTSVYFVVNDVFNTKNLPSAPLPDGVVIDSLNRVATKHPEWIEGLYDVLATQKANTLPLLNTLFAQDGLYIHVPAGVKVERPIQIVNILRSEVELMANRRVLIDIEAGAEATVLICDHTADDRRFLVNEVSEVRVGDGASLQMYALEENGNKVQRFTHTYVQQGTESMFTHAAITLGTGLSLNRLCVNMHGEGASCNLYGAVIADGQQHVDHGTQITHNAPGCTSHQLYKYVLDDYATGAFAGRILVPHGMQRTVSDMVNANLIGADTARMYTQPMLEIYADDVQCSHGSTVGQLNDAALIYMRQRGIPEDEARLLLKQAFASQVIESIQLPSLRDRLTHLVEKRFRGELAHCEGCKLCKE